MSNHRQAHPAGQGGPRGSWLLAGGAVVVVGALLAGVVALGGGGSQASPPASGTAGAVASAGPSAPAGSAAPSAAPGSPSPTPAPSPTATPLAAVPIVPVADWRTTATTIVPADVSAVVAGTSKRWTQIEVVAGESAAVLEALGLRAVPAAKLVTAPDAATLMTDLAAHRNRLAFLRADAVGPGVRALGWKGQNLFGIHRLKTPDTWPLTAQLPLGPGGTPDPAATWTMFAAGDLGLDRTYAYVVKNQGKGIDYPFDGGTARITKLVCCSAFGWKVPTIVSTGHKGAMRSLITDADLALANMEEAAPDKFTFHRHGTVFTGDPALIKGIANAGIDVTSVATTHIGDGGKAGILQTIASLKKYGIVPFGAGPNLAAARQPAIFELGGVKVAILGYDGISAKWYGATATTIGDAPLTSTYIKEDVRAARAAGAQVVIVYPHWGVEYTYGPNKTQQTLAHIAIDAGADIVIGNHPHWVQSVEIYKGKPIWYALGNFTFDQSWSEPTLEGVTLELTFRGATLVQAWMNPHILVAAVQPNLLDLAGDGQRVLAPVYKASGKLLPW